MARKGNKQNNNKQNNNKPKQNSPFFVAKEIRLEVRRLENVIFPAVTK